MAAQNQTSNLAAKLGGRLSKANALHKDKPVDLGFRKLPPGIKNGIAKLQKITINQYKKGDLIGEDFVQFQLVMVYPKEHDGMIIDGIITSKMFPLCDTKANPAYEIEAKPFEDHFYDFQNMIKMLSNGAMVCPETDATDPSGQKTWAFFLGCIQALTDPKRPLVYVNVTTDEFTPSKKPGQKEAPKPKTVERWPGLADPETVKKIRAGHNPAASVKETPSSNGVSPQPFDEMPTGIAAATVQDKEENTNDAVAELVETAMADPGGKTDEGQQASQRLEQMALANGWTEDQVTTASTWAEVGDMALNPPDVHDEGQEDQEETEHDAKVVGARFMFANRDRNGEVMKDKKGDPFPAREVEITSVDPEKKTCTVKTTKDGKDLLDAKKKPVVVKWEWLE